MEDNKKLLEDLVEEVEKDEELNSNGEREENETTEAVEECLEENNEDKENELEVMRKLKDENKRLNNELEALKDRLLRVSAEYENYRKRTTKEKEGIYTDACSDVLKEMIPVLDNLERAMTVEGSLDDFKKGIEMTIKQFNTSFEKLGVEEIDASGKFDPNFHQAVMHVEDENFGENEIAEVFQKGYKRGDKIIRYTVVKVAN
ncbi:MAG: nucleotide exchange factor GrpE [Clostridiales bacterium]|nr:nucleotide exchange factor GrpE [Clostridiales bacterium]